MRCELCKDEVIVLHPTVFGWICFKCFQDRTLREGLPAQFKDSNGKMKVHISVKSSKADSLVKQKADLNKVIL